MVKMLSDIEAEIDRNQNLNNSNSEKTSVKIVKLKWITLLKLLTLLFLFSTAILTKLLRQILHIPSTGLDFTLTLWQRILFKRRAIMMSLVK